MLTKYQKFLICGHEFFGFAFAIMWIIDDDFNCFLAALLFWVYAKVLKIEMLMDLKGSNSTGLKDE